MNANLRHLRAFLAVADTSSITRAAELSGVSQPAVTQSLKKLESGYEVELFERTPRGLFPTSAGKVLERRVRRAFDVLDEALRDIAPRLILTATSAQLNALVAAVEAENFALAARRLGLAQPTVHRAISELEHEAGRALFERTSRGMLATRSAAALARAGQLAFAELEQADAELGELVGKEVGRIVIGAMPLSRASILPSAIAGFRRKWPNLLVRAVDGPYSDLVDGLRRGQLDFLVGALRDPAPMDDVHQEALFSDEMVVVCGPEHDATSMSDLRIEGLSGFPWIVAPTGTPARIAFDRAFTGTKLPQSIFESSSAVLMRQLLRISNHLGFISAVQVSSDVRSGDLIRLPIDLHETARPIGISTRAGWQPTKAQAALIDEVREAAAAAAWSDGRSRTPPGEGSLDNA